MKVWIYINGSQRGPYEVDELIQQGVTPETRIWFSGMPKWYPAGEVEEIRHIFGNENACEEESFHTPSAPPQVPVPPQSAPAPMPATQPSPAQTLPPCPPSHLVWSIILTVLCCSPIAIAALVTGIMTTTRYAAGNYESARRLSTATEWLIMAAFALGLLPLMFVTAIL